MYVNSGHTFAANGVLYHSGKVLPKEIISSLEKAKVLDKHIKQGRIVKHEPRLDDVSDKKTGSATIKKVDVPKKEPKGLPQTPPPITPK